MQPMLIAVVAIFSTVTLVLLGLGLFIPDTLTPTLSELQPRHVFRLPQGARRVSSRQWVWQNDTVQGIFQVYEGADLKSVPRKPAIACCKKLSGRLFEAEGFEIEAANDGSFSSSAMTSVFSDAVSRWEAIVGNKFGSISTVSESAGLVFNGKNQVGLGALDIDVPNALAVTGLWMVCPAGGAISTCDTVLKISEWDQTYAIAERDWSLVGAGNAYDLPSVVVHEFGHSVGLNDLDSDSCVSSTMFGSSGRGETFRRSIDAETKSCAQDLYGISSDSSSQVWPRAVLALLVLWMI